jgi:hypothetical protein
MVVFERLCRRPESINNINEEKAEKMKNEKNDELSIPQLKIKKDSVALHLPRYLVVSVNYCTITGVVNLHVL